MRKQRLLNAIVIENPRYAGGRLGASHLDEVDDPRFAYGAVLEATLDVFRQLGIESERIPLIVAGGIFSFEQVHALLSMGASAVQLGTAFAVTEEGDAHPAFKKVLADARPEDIVTFMSGAGLTARAVRTPWLSRYLKKEAKLQSKATPKKCTVGFDCLSQCGWRDGIGKAGQFCIDTQLGFALKGDVVRGLFFRGLEQMPFGNEIRPVRELIQYLVTGAYPPAREYSAA